MKKGAIKLNVLYPTGKGKHFDMDYYANKHVALVTELLGDAIIGASVAKGIGGAAPGEEAPYKAMGILYFESVDSFQNSFGPNAAQIMADLPNFTNIEPVVQISEVVM